MVKVFSTLSLLAPPLLAFAFVACASKITPATTSLDLSYKGFKIQGNRDVLNIGTTPSEPSKKLRLVKGQDNTLKLNVFKSASKPQDTRALVDKRHKLKAMLASNSSYPIKNDIVKGPNEPVDPSNPFDDTKVFYNKPEFSDYVSILGQNDALITVWALASGNWVWGYSPINSISFGDARNWQLIIYPKDYVQIRNKLTNTCLNGYLNGVIHTICQDTNQAQFWELKPFANGAVQIKNFGTGTCIASDLAKGASYYSIKLEACQDGLNLSQQWQIIPPANTTTPIVIDLKTLKGRK
ncbi:RICIN domain-containing protein [Helicobacter sp. 11S02629-2]|uniref:RICIN domain-containing protein n=1 Tax=Helicobacter sp. 11S02629-2 TaxID=1476195 RepID=UPI000BD9E5D0|nr:RICIN domain-containing protein [Helicobacter sp. 11S02629-2]PAF42529.1 hypothetical protein BKH40_07750 [Helicobacter sp. 11S02629-2]